MGRGQWGGGESGESPAAQLDGTPTMDEGIRGVHLRW